MRSGGENPLLRLFHLTGHALNLAVFSLAFLAILKCLIDINSQSCRKN